MLKAPVRRRPTARVILRDEQGRVFLFRYEDPSVVDEPDNASRSPLFWCTPGGGVWPGESYADAARRELREETGIDHAELGPCVWTRTKQVDVGGVTVLVHERYFLASVRSEGLAISLDSQEELERGAYRDHRWWSVDEIARSDELFFPVGFAGLLAALVPDRESTRPIRLT